MKSVVRRWKGARSISRYPSNFLLDPIGRRKISPQGFETKNQSSIGCEHRVHLSQIRGHTCNNRPAESPCRTPQIQLECSLVFVVRDADRRHQERTPHQGMQMDCAQGLLQGVQRLETRAWTKGSRRNLGNSNGKGGYLQHCSRGVLCRFYTIRRARAQREILHRQSYWPLLLSSRGRLQSLQTDSCPTLLGEGFRNTEVFHENMQAVSL